MNTLKRDPTSSDASTVRRLTSAAWRVTAALALVLSVGGVGAAGALASTSVTFHVVNTRGIAQWAEVWVNGNQSAGLTTDYSGNLSLAVNPGDVVSFSRDATDNACGGAPEGMGGVTYTVPSTPTSAATITLPVTTGPSYQPQLSPAERWVVGKINADRVANGAGPLTISMPLTLAADAVAHDNAVGPYRFPPPYCLMVPIDWGWPYQSPGAPGAEDAPYSSPQAALGHFTGGPRQQLTINPTLDTIGIGDGGPGSGGPGSGAWIIFLAACPDTNPATSRCGLTGDQGDASIVLPPPPTAPSNSSRPSISGPARVGQTLVASNGAWSGTAPLSYADQWQRCHPGCSNITGATGSSYTLVAADAGSKVRVVVTASNDGGSAQSTSDKLGPVLASGPSGPSASQIKALLLTELSPAGKTARIGALLKQRGYLLSFKALSAGRAAISWYLVPKGAHITTGKSKPQPVLVATGSASFSTASTRAMTIRLTAKGKRLLEHARSMKLTAKGTFSPHGKTAITATKTFTVKR